MNTLELFLNFELDGQNEVVGKGFDSNGYEIGCCDGDGILEEPITDTIVFMPPPPTMSPSMTPKMHIRTQIKRFVR